MSGYSQREYKVFTKGLKGIDSMDFLATPKAYGISRARERIQAAARTYATAVGMQHPLTHWARGASTVTHASAVRSLTH